MSTYFRGLASMLLWVVVVTASVCPSVLAVSTCLMATKYQQVNLDKPNFLNSRQKWLQA